MTNHWIDLKNADVILIMGANPAENHPVSFRWIMKAKDAGAKVICVDPRFTRSAAKADLYAPLRSGSDIAFLGGMIVHTMGENVINIEGDPDHPINEGALCPKGASLYQLRNNKARLTRPLYRPAGATEWQAVTWEWAIDEIAKRVKTTRDATFVPTSRIKVKEKRGDAEVEKELEAVVNRTMGMASVGSAALDNEECYLYQKFLRGLGLVYIEHQARI